MFGGITITYTGPPKYRAATLRRFKKDTLTRVAFKWHAWFHARHFTTEGARAYGYGRRATKNVMTGQVRKTKAGRPRAPSGDPLVWSGRSRAAARRVRVRATSNQSRAIMDIRALNFRPPKNQQLDMRSEATKVLASEAARLRADARQYLTQRFRDVRHRVTVRIGPTT